MSGPDGTTTARTEGRSAQRSKAEELLDESSMAYKDIDVVMADQADLVQVEHRLDAIVNYKGA